MPKSEKPYLPHERLDPPGTAINLIEGYLSYDCGTVVSNQSDLLTPLWGLPTLLTNFRSFFIFSISPGIFWAKVSLRVYGNFSGLKYRIDDIVEPTGVFVDE